MPFVLRKSSDEANPRLPDAWGVQTTAGRLVYWAFDGSRTYFLVLFGRGGKYGWDGLNFFRYKGVPISEFIAGNEGNEDFRQWRFHPGTVTKQLVVKNAAANAATDVLTANAHGYSNNDPVRLRSLGGVVPSGLAANQQYFVINKTDNTFQLSALSGGAAIDLTDGGSGTLKIWKADAGFDDPAQGRTQFFPELNLTFSNIAYIEGYIPAPIAADGEPTEFEFGVRCRKIADFDNAGNYLGNGFSANNARVQADILLNELKRPKTRQNWASWFAFKQACNALIWDRGVADAAALGTGLTGRYFTGINFDAQYKTKVDAEINFTWADGATVEGDSSDYHSIQWEGKIKPQFSETHTFELTHNDGARLFVNNELIIDQFAPIGGAGGVGTHTGMIALVGGSLFNIRLEFRNYLGGECKLSWSSPSRSKQIVPAARLYPLDTQVTRHRADVVFDGATQAGAAIEEVMKRSPGWHIQDVNGKFNFLPPDRSVVHTFLYDPNAADQRWNIASKTFEASPRKSDERPNFRIHYYNDLTDDLLAQKSVEGNREKLRENQGGFPTELAPAKWGVMTRSSAARIAENEMRLFSDPDRSFILRGQSDSYHVSKGDRVLLAHIATADTYSHLIECLVASEGFGSGDGDEKNYTLLPVKFPIIEDEPV